MTGCAVRVHQRVELETAVRMYYETLQQRNDRVIKDVPSWDSLYGNARIAYRAWGLDMKKN